jgi:tetratricopeptide (TPR) repeat protein
MHLLGDHLLLLGRPTEARQLLFAAPPILERTGARKEQLCGRHSLDLVSTLTNLATVQHRGGDLGSGLALASIDRALKISETSERPNLFAVGNLHGSRATVLLDDGHPTEPVAESQRALAAFEAHDPPFTAGIAIARGNLANALLDSGHITDSIRESRLALAGKRALSGEDHSSVADTYGNLGNAVRAAEGYVEAEACFRKALAIREGQQSPDLLAIAKDRASLGVVLVRDGHHDDGIALQERAAGARCRAGKGSLVLVRRAGHR